jgi:hypothetical protein
MIDVKKIENTDIFIDDFDKIGQGKITISNPWMGAFTYGWYATRSHINEFLKDIDSDYFAKNLCRNMYVFDGKKSVTNIRKYIREELKYDLPFYKFQKLQKEMRIELKKLEACESDTEFVDMCRQLPDEIFCYDTTYDEKREFIKIINEVFKDEPWNFISRKKSPEYIWLKNLHSKLKKIIKENNF